MAYVDGSRVKGGQSYRQRTATKNHIRRLHNYTCALCGGYGDQVDHIIPYAMSHDSTLANLRVLCRPCNLTTRHKRYDALPEIDEWYKKLKSDLAASGYIRT